MTGSGADPQMYLQRGRPVEVVTRWGRGGGPRNVLIRRDTGELVVRPFRGLRRPQPASLEPAAGSARRGPGRKERDRDE